MDGPAVESAVDIDYQTKEPMRLAGWRYTCMHPAAHNQPTRFYTLNVDKCDINPAMENSQFSIEPRVGMVVHDARERRAYVLESGGVKTPLRIAFARHEQLASFYRRAVTWGGFACAIVLVAAGVWLWRKYR
jgi:hypothetical protein